MQFFTHKQLKIANLQFQTNLVSPFVVLSAVVECLQNSFYIKIQKLTKFRVRKFNSKFLVAVKTSGIRTTTLVCVIQTDNLL